MDADAQIPPASDLSHFRPLRISVPKPPEVSSLSNPPPNPARPTSYAAALRPISPRASKTNFEEIGDNFKEAVIYNNKPGIFYSEEEVAGMAEPYRFSLIGKFSGLRPSQPIVLQAFKNLGFSGFYNIHFLRSGYIFMHLTSAEDMARVLTRCVWFIGGVPMLIFKWTPNFSYASESSVVPVWIQFPDLPIHMFNKEVLFSAANIVGNPIEIDEATADGSRLSMARICVEIDLLKPKVDQFWIGIGTEKRLQRVVYEKHPKYCTHCLHLGHSEDECYVNGNKPRPAWNAAKRMTNIAGEDLTGSSLSLLPSEGQQIEPTIKATSGMMTRSKSHAKRASSSSLF